MFSLSDEVVGGFRQVVRFVDYEGFDAGVPGLDCNFRAGKFRDSFAAQEC
jgi:hypothetical protein